MKEINVFGKRSVSEVLNIILKIAWIFVWAGPIISLIVLIVLSSMVGFDQAIIDINKNSNMNLNSTKDLIFEIIHWATYMVTIWKLKKLFSNFTNKKIFILENIVAIRIISAAFFVKTMVTGFSFEGIFIASVIFILAEIFKVGDDLKKETESIV